MTWRPMRSLAELDNPRAGLRGQVNAIAPGRAKGSDGLIGDAAHESTSGHYPHFVAGVGSEIVTALDLTHDPASGCDTVLLAEVLRKHRDKRIRYVISARRIFSSYATASRAAWEWGPYSGIDPHLNHGHYQVLDAVISDTATPWNLQGFGSEDEMSSQTEYIINKVLNQRIFAIAHMREVINIPADVVDGKPVAAITEPNDLAIAVNRIKADVAAIKDSLAHGGTPGDGDAAAIAEVEKKVDALIDGIAANAAAVVAGVTP